MNNNGLLELSLARIPQLHCADRIRLAQMLSSEQDLLRLALVDIEKMLGKASTIKNWNPTLWVDSAARDAENAQRRGIGILSYFSEQYPPLLRELSDPPLLMFFRGALPDPEKPLVAIVGTRKPDAPAMSQALQFGLGFARLGIPVISGLALGIDAMAHRGNVEGGAASVAVLGSGLDGIYPASNRGLARRLIENGGCLLSEYPPGVGPQKWHFPARNRIISVLARAMLVVEAPEHSGALISAQFALDQGRDLWVASSGMHSTLGAGCRNLADQGARIAGSAKDIVDDWIYSPEPLKKGPGVEQKFELQQE